MKGEFLEAFVLLIEEALLVNSFFFFSLFEGCFGVAFMTLLLVFVLVVVVGVLCAKALFSGCFLRFVFGLGCGFGVCLVEVVVVEAFFQHGLWQFLWCLWESEMRRNTQLVFSFWSNILCLVKNVKCLFRNRF